MARCIATTKAGKSCKAAAYQKGKCIFHLKVGARPGRDSVSYARAAKEARRYRKRR